MPTEEVYRYSNCNTLIFYYKLFALRTTSEGVITSSSRVLTRMFLKTLSAIAALFFKTSVSSSGLYTYIHILYLNTLGFKAQIGKDFQPLVKSGTVVFAARCSFASEMLWDSPGDSPTCSKQRMNKMSTSWWSCCLETQNARWCHAEWRPQDLFYGLLLGNR